MSAACTRPPAGWWCSREEGHDGPCAARPVGAPVFTEIRRRWYGKQTDDAKAITTLLDEMEERDAVIAQWADEIEQARRTTLENARLRAGRSRTTRLIETLTYNLYLAGLVGNPAPRVAELHERMRNPQVGDLVLETSTIYHDIPKRLGRLLRVTEEPCWTPDEWAGEEGPIPTDRFWYIEVDGEEVRWNNCSFIAVPTDIVYYNSDFKSDPEQLNG